MSTWLVTQTVTFIMPRRKRGVRVTARAVKPFWCQWPGCFKAHTIDCYFPDNNGDTPDELLCAHHAPKAGFCWGCGNFWAGVESFDFNTNNLCDNCKDDPDLTGDYGDDDYPDDYDFAGDDLPF